MSLQRAYQFLVVLLLILPAQIFSQQQMPRIGQNSPHSFLFSKNFRREWSIENVDKNFAAKVGLTPNRDYYFNNEKIPQFNISSLPFFCKKEFQFEKNTSIPLRLRLGSLDYVNKLEGKK